MAESVADLISTKIPAQSTGIPAYSFLSAE